MCLYTVGYLSIMDTLSVSFIKLPCYVLTVILWCLFNGRILLAASKLFQSYFETPNLFANCLCS